MRQGYLCLRGETNWEVDELTKVLVGIRKSRSAFEESSRAVCLGRLESFFYIFVVKRRTSVDCTKSYGKSELP